jgi:DNA helicase HerA-like ATPase
VSIDPTRILVGKSDREVYLLSKYGNRHGLIAGATGTGKTVTLQALAEGFSDIGTSVFLADIKGDLSGLCQPGGGNDKVDARLQEIGLTDYPFKSYPVVFWDLFGKQGHPIRTTISEMGPLLLSRLLGLNDTQEGVLNIAFRVADEEGLLLLDLKDLRTMLAYMGEKASELTRIYGNVTSASIGAIQRQLLVLEGQGGNNFFGEPALELRDLFRTELDGRGMINILAADQLMQNPRLYSTFLLWLLSELFEELPEVGDLDKPKMVFFFDEAHLLFNDAPPALVDKVEQVVRLIRSKGVGVYFISQNPLDIPDKVLGQLGNRVQHALRAFTPRDQKAVNSAADTFRVNPAFSTKEVITQLAVGEALVSCLEAGGVPMEVQRTLIKPPSAHVGPCDPATREKTFQQSPVRGKYDTVLDRESAYEVLTKSFAKAAEEEAAAKEAAAREAEATKAAKQQAAAKKPAAKRSDSAFEAMTKSVARAAGSQLGRQLVRGVLGGLFGNSRKR